MGMIIHTALVVTCTSDEVKSAHKKAKKIFGKNTSKLLEQMNGFYSFTVLSNGSKYGWEASYEFSSKIEEFEDYLDSKGIKYFEAMYGETRDGIEITKPYSLG